MRQGPLGPSVTSLTSLLDKVDVADVPLGNGPEPQSAEEGAG